jgi:hypothetical protein
MYTVLQDEIGAAASNIELWQHCTVLFSIATKDLNRMDKYRKNAT